MKNNKTKLSILAMCCLSSNIFAAELSDDHISVDILQLSRESGKSFIYLYDNGGTPNTPANDTALDTTKTFSDTAEPGYRLSGSKKISEKWAINVAILNEKMDITRSFSSPAGRLEIFQNSLTNEFDSAHTVQSDYRSTLGIEDISSIFKYSDALDFILGIGHIKLNEKFKMTSDDTGTVGIGTYNIHTDNNMLGINAGINYSLKTTDKFGVIFTGKIGWYENKAEQRQQLNENGLTRNNSGSDSTSSTLTDLRLGLYYHVSQKLSININYQETNITNVALAESHLNTTASGSNLVVSSDDIKWSGLNLGLSYMF